MMHRVIVIAILITGCLSAACSSEKKKSQVSGNLLEEITPSQVDSVITQFEGRKAVLVNIWATWCGPCVEEFPDIVELQQTYPNQLQVIFISTDFPGDEDRVRSFLRDHDVDWTTYIKRGNDQEFIEAVSSEWSGAQPFTKILNSDGKVIASWENSRDFDTFERYVKQAINP